VKKTMQKTTFMVHQMDCPAEEQLVRMKLTDQPGISSLQFDIPARRVEVFHTGDSAPILQALESLELDATLIGSIDANEPAPEGTTGAERKTLLLVLAINAFFFLLESLTGFLSNSMGLVADGLDMLADSLVYGMALFAIGGSIARKQNIARASGYFQIVLAVVGIIEVLRRFLGFEEIPAFQTMILVSFLALIGNAASLYILQKSKNREAHMRASLIFTSNDVIINLGVILAGVLVFISGSRVPDLVIGAIVFVIVARGAYRILQIAKG
jgi:Co/Zn/Cd efflux system component